jgi:vesicle-fusing ATPase
MKVNCSNFIKVLDKIKPAFRVLEKELDNTITGGIFYFSPYINNILRDSRLFVDLIRVSKTTFLLSVLLYGSYRSGKTALAVAIAKES